MTNEERFVRLINQSLKDEGLNESEVLTVKMYAFLVSEILQSYAFPIRSKLGKATLRTLLNSIELIEMEQNEKKNN